MLGHKAYQILSKDFDAYVTFRRFSVQLKNTKIFDEKKVFDNVDAFRFHKIINVIDKVKPQIILNCIGIIKQSKEVVNQKFLIYINSLLSHLLAEYCEKVKAKLIHISTDCVFSGKKGNYTEEQVSDAEDLYGKTKFLGEVSYGNNLTLRTSIIGRELFSNLSLVDWFLSQESKTVNGYTNAIYTGVTTITLCNEIKRIINKIPYLSGIYHISAEKISKFDLLNLIKNVYNLNTEIKHYNDFYCDRSLDSTKYRKETNFHPPSWEKMIREMYCDSTSYHLWRNI